MVTTAATVAGGAAVGLVAPAGGVVAAATGATVLARRWRPSTPPTSAEQVERCWQTLDRELARARRHGLNLALARITCGGHVDGRVDVGVCVRSSDAQCVAGQQLHVVLTEVDRVGAALALRRIERALFESGVTVTSSALASFPTDGLTSGALIAALDGLHVGPVRTPFAARVPGVDLDVIDLRDTEIAEPQTTASST